MLLPSASSSSFRAHVQLCALPGAGVWLTAPPTQDGREIDAALFQVALKRRLRVPIFSSDAACPCCGDCLDRSGDHALVCQCNGDRTIRHNAVRNSFFDDAREAGLRPEREKAGLLPPRPHEDGLRANAGSRRPADVWLPRGAVAARDQALDFACTSGMQAGLLERTADNPYLVFEQYEDFKRSFAGTAAACEGQGLAFVPIVMDSGGCAWIPTARWILDAVAKASSSTWNLVGDSSSIRFAQRLSTALHRENARAILRRSSAAVDVTGPSGWAEAAFI